MAKRDVTRFVRDDAFQFFRRAGRHDQACVDEYILAARDLRLNLVALHNVDIHVGGLEAGALEQWIAIVPKDLLDLGVTDQALRRSRHGQRQGQR